MIQIVQLLHYQLLILIIGANDDLEHELSLYNGVYTSNDPLIKKEFLVKLGDLKVGNFYKTIPPIINNLKKIMKEIKKEHKNVNLNDFTFSPRFQCLSTFQEDIKDKNLEHEEIQELLKFLWCAFNQRICLYTN